MSYFERKVTNIFENFKIILQLFCERNAITRIRRNVVMLQAQSKPSQKTRHALIAIKARSYCQRGTLLLK